jgi:hypothetical protein
LRRLLANGDVSPDERRNFSQRLTGDFRGDQVRFASQAVCATVFRMSLTTALVVVIAVAGLAVLVRFETYVLADLARTPDDQLLPFFTWGWAAVCLLSPPFAGPAY